MSTAQPEARLRRVAIVGRPNVGKSTLLNRLVQSRVAIVEPTAGVTRDRIAVPARIPTPWGERTIEVIDTGGIGIVDRDDLGPHVEEKIKAGLEVADLIVIDGNPLVDIQQSEFVSYVIQNGRVYDAANMNEIGNYDVKRAPFFWERSKGSDAFPWHENTGSMMEMKCGCHGNNAHVH